MPQLIVYACPMGPLTEQIESYLKESERLCGENAAHQYMPHCTLTGFFQDERSAIAHYIDKLNEVLQTAGNTISRSDIHIRRLSFKSDWHGLELEADWLKQLIAQFAQIELSATRKESLRLKDWLHLSLAYQFQPKDSETLKRLATEIIDISTAVNWELRLYERSDQNCWTCNARWPLET